MLKGAISVNKSNTPTLEKRKFTLRLSPEVYRQVQNKVFVEKAENHNLSINEYITQLITADLKISERE